MTPIERARLRDKVARAKLARAPETDPDVIRARAWAAGVLKKYDLPVLEPVSSPRKGKRRGPYRLKQRRCVYCGIRVSAKLEIPVCHSHSDLPELDQAFREAQQLRETA